ncbi:lysine--tRNA ligase [Sulfurovum sp. bin170]|uniref:lysine--tRNA ligase n=1 Tax=Sulfurovum sp. bin170 TaxID=2695268 RepID=UPI0013DFC54E|nr:lysine--tRNA ligase [Sulfurovum sp. bin170]NEW60938.1 lysine--tRNA ligase [Sulfurovum sp. bin170]
MKWLKDIEKHLVKRKKDGVIIINDSKTPSGKIHVGSLRGVIIHDAIFRYLQNRGHKVKFTYGIDDYDPMDGLPHDASEEMKQHMGKPMCNIPAPSDSDASDLANYYIEDFLEIFKELGVEVEIYRLRDIYRSGRFNDAIDTILSHADIVRDIYLEVSNSEKPDNWYPFQVVCEECGKLGTTIVTDYSDKLVTYECKKDLVSWAEGCGHRGRISPFDGNGKLPWKLEWVAKWHEFGIDIEGAGMDHCTKGGSRDVGNACFRAIFQKQPPINVPYGFFLINGSKMSSSKGLGFSARDMTDFLPPEILRYLMINNQVKRPVEFSVDANKMLKLFNDYDRVLAGHKDEILNLTETDRVTETYKGTNFQMLTTFVQILNLDIEKEIEKREGRALTEREKSSLSSRIASAKYWLDNYATDEDRFELQNETPPLMETLTEAQKEFLVELGKFLTLDETNREEQVIKDNIYEIARKTPISATDAFQAVYKSLLNKDYGSKVWILLSAVPLKLLEDRFLTIGVNEMDFINEVKIDELESVVDNIKKIQEVEDKIYSKNGEYLFAKKISFLNMKDRDEVYFIALKKEQDISEDYWSAELYPLIQDKI